MSLDCCGLLMTMDTEGLTTRGAWGMGLIVSPEQDPVNNYDEDHKLMEGALIKLGDYAHFRYFLLYRNGRFCYYELPIPAGSPGGGTRRVHLTLTTDHLRGVMMLNASLHAKELAKNEEEYDADLIKRGLMFNRKNLEMNLTGYSPTGQLMSWKLRASNDATYVKWERAFRLALRPIWVQNTHACLVCQKAFTFLFRAHHCRKCGTCMCEECSVFVPRLPMQGYYDEVRICRDCSPVRIQRSSLKKDTRVLVYGIYPGRVVQVEAADDSEGGRAYVNVELEKSGQVRKFALEFVELYSEAVLSANRIKNAIRLHLSQSLFRTQLNFSTWNLLETVQEQKTVQMVRILNKSTSITELRSMVPNLGSLETFQFPIDDESESDKVRASLAHYRGVHVVFPLRLDTVTKLIDQFRNGILLHRVYVHHILEESEKMFRIVHASPMNAIEIPAGVTLIVVGDLHGQLEDLLTILDKNGVPSQKMWYLFNGDFVDRGSHGVEVMLLLLTFKLLYPNYVFLNRGNHEERMINEVFGFEDEVYVKYNTDNDETLGWEGLSMSANYSPMKLFQMFEDIFTLFPIFSLVNESVFVVHGGLSHHNNVRIEELLQIKHQREIPTQSTEREDELFTHLLWSDPRDRNGWKPSGRGAGVEFGPDITRQFCQLNHLCLVIRSHECREEGYEITHDGLLLTVFSASSYCGSQTNKGAFVQLQTMEHGDVKPHVVQYYAQPLQKLRDAGKNEWRQKALRLERRTLMSLVELICEKKSSLWSAFARVDASGTGRVTKLQWKDMLQRTLGIEVNFLSYFRQLATLEQDALGGVDYKKFLNRYTVELGGGNADWKKQIAQEIWLGFSRALAQTGGGSSQRGGDPKMTSQNKLQAAFELFQLTSQYNSNVNGSPPPETNGGSTISFASQRSNESYLHSGLVTYDVFRATLQRHLVLTETLSEQQIFELMQQMDQNHDGFVDFGEFCTFFAEVSQSDFLQTLFDGEDVKAIEWLHQLGSRLQESTQFESLKGAFVAFDRGQKARLDIDDILAASKTMELSPTLDESDARLLYDSILRSYYGVTMRKEKEQRGLDWEVFEDVFSPDSTRQRRMRLESWSASTTNLAALLESAQQQTGCDDESGTESSPVAGASARRNTWAETLVDSVKHSLHEQRLYLKLLFRMLDRKRAGYVSRDKFLAVVNVINEQHGSFLDHDELEQLAASFAYRKGVKRAASTGGEDVQPQEEQPSEVAWVAYPLFLRSLRVIDSKCKCC
uniref:Serine/threonine-protein phosphatase n=1 Tax=Globisporangium ultimum (strain ATCC 200006 / CBS 805.95 / DAOM BR144) TaxID=431595 RepID=K3WX33_GLOUD